MNTDWRTTYNDLCNEIEILAIREYEIRSQLKRVQQQMMNMSVPQTKLVASYSGMPGSGFAMMPFDQVWGNIAQLERELEDIRDVLSLKREAQQRMESKMNNFEDILDRIMVMRDIQRKPLRDIAAELDYSYDWIKKLSSRAGKLYKVNAKKGTIHSRIS